MKLRLTSHSLLSSIAALFGAALAGLVLPSAAFAQPPTTPGETAASDTDSSEDEVTLLRRTVEEQGRRIAALESRDQENSERIKQLEDSQTQTQELVMTGESLEGMEMDDEQQRLRVYGFFDLTLNRFFFDDNSAWNLYLTEPLSFTISHVNLYVQANLTDTLSSLVEVRFSFQPSGDETSWEAGIRNEDGSIMDVPGTSYQRYDTYSTDPFTTENNRFGWVMIERAQLTWSPREGLQFTAGRYLTPYGVWNVDHASTVVLPVRLPYMQLRDMIIKAQTGVMAFGRIFPHPKLFLDYAFTVSNGSGRTEANLDFDDEKAFGLKLALTFMGEDLTAEVGGYAAYTTWADRKEKVIVDQTHERMSVDVRPYDVTKELMVSAHTKLQFFGVLLQSEFALHNTYYEVPPELGTGDPDRAILIKDLSESNKYFWASSVGWGVYGLVGYTLPLRQWLGEVLITPYFMYEKNRTNDTKPHWNMTLVMAGLNVQPNRYVTLKAEWALAKPEYTNYGANAQSVSAQMAVSF